VIPAIIEAVALSAIIREILTCFLINVPDKTFLSTTRTGIFLFCKAVRVIASTFQMETKINRRSHIAKTLKMLKNTGFVALHSFFRYLYSIFSIFFLIPFITSTIAIL